MGAATVSVLSFQIPVVFRLPDFNCPVNVHILDVFHKDRIILKGFRAKDEFQLELVHIGLNIRHDGVVLGDLLRHGRGRQILYPGIRCLPHLKGILLHVIGKAAQHVILFHQERLIVAARMDGERLLNGQPVRIVQHKLRKLRLSVHHLIGHAFLPIIGGQIALLAVVIVQHSRRRLWIGAGCGDGAADGIHPVAALIHRESLSCIQYGIGCGLVIHLGIFRLHGLDAAQGSARIAPYQSGSSAGDLCKESVRILGESVRIQYPPVHPAVEQGESVLLGIVVIMYPSRKNYEPVSQIIHYIQGNGEMPEPESDEYRFILKVLDKNRNEIHRQQEQIKNNYLQKIFTEEISFSQIPEPVAKQFCLELPSPYVCVVLFHVKEAEESGEISELTAFIIRNVYQELLCPVFADSYFSVQRHRIAVLVSTPDEESAPLLHLEAKTRQLLAFLSDSFQLSLRAGVSGILSRENILDAYLQADTALEYERLFEAGPLCLYDSIPLLSRTELKIADIAHMTGFVDSNAYIRIFKKLKGTTPGRFKEMQAST